MAVRLGVIADDFTGATDIAGFLVANGLRTVQLTGVPAEGTTVPKDADAVVISLKSRSIPAQEAVSVSLAALRFLQAQGAERFYFKYCSTFDSTPAGNIGPVTDALLGALGEDFTVICPSLPVNGRTTYRGYLFVEDVPLHESGMSNHPITPMTDSNVMRLMDAQAQGSTGNVQAAVIAQGPAAVREALTALRTEGYRYAVLDTITEANLDVLGQAVADYPLVTGGSGLGAGLARALSGATGAHTTAWQERDGRTVVLSGSSSVMTNQQVAAYREAASSLAVNVDQLVAVPEDYRQQILQWVLDQPTDGPAPLVSATASPEEVSRLQEAHGAHEVSEAIEGMFGWLASALADRGVRRFIVAGGETSGAVTTALGVTGFEVGPQIAPGVPWVRSISSDINLALKSGNFGDVDFFSLAQAPRH